MCSNKFNKLHLIRLVLITILVLLVSSIAINADESRKIIPGVQIGLIKPETSPEDVENLYAEPYYVRRNTGPILRYDIYTLEERFARAFNLFGRSAFNIKFALLVKENRDESEEIRFVHHPDQPNSLEYFEITDWGEDWSVEPKLKPLMTVEELEHINQSQFRIKWASQEKNDYGTTGEFGEIVSWESGVLSKHADYIKNYVRLRLRGKIDYQCDLSGRETLSNFGLFADAELEVYLRILVPGIGQPISKELQGTIKELPKASVEEKAWEVLAWGDEKELEQLIKTGFNFNEPIRSQIPLIRALRYENVKVALLLLNKRVKSNVRSPDSTLVTPLMYASEKHSLHSVFNHLLKKSDNIGAKDARGKTALHYAVSGCNLEAVRKLIDHKANINATDKDGKTPLVYAIEDNKKEVFNTIVKAKANIDIQDKDGKTALMFATEYWSENYTSDLLTSGAKTDVQDSLGNTALHYAFNQRNFNLVEQLISAGANPDIPNNKSVTPRMLVEKIVSPKLKKRIHNFIDKKTN